MRATAIIAALPAMLKQDAQRERLDRVYFEQMKAIAQSVAKAHGGSWIGLSYDEAIDITPKVEDTRSAEEQVRDIAARAGLEIIYDCT